MHLAMLCRLYLNKWARRPMDRKERSRIVKYTIHSAASPPEIVEDDRVLHKAPIAFLLGLVLLASGHLAA